MEGENMKEIHDLKGEDEEEGVLLYYKYVTIPNPTTVVDWFRANCTSLGLLGRVRVAPEGINVTVGGKMTSLKKHIAAVDSDTLFQCCDFKLASCQRPSDQRIAKECGFTSLSVRAVKEVVTLGFYPLVKSPPISNAGKHLSAIEFHSVLQMAGKSHLDMSLESLTLQLESKPGDFQQHRGLVLLDARNAYETRIGKFLPPKGVEILEPKIRQYSDLPSWIDGHLDQLHGNHILMTWHLKSSNGHDCFKSFYRSVEQEDGVYSPFFVLNCQMCLTIDKGICGSVTHLFLNREISSKIMRSCLGSWFLRGNHHFASK